MIYEMIEKLSDSDMIRPYEVGRKINEIIEAVNEITTSPFTRFPYTNQLTKEERTHEDDGA